MAHKSSFLNEAVARGFFYQSTDLEAMDEYLANRTGRGYLGIDVTASCLHVGHLIPVFLLRLFQKHGHKPVILLGGGTTKIGDPSFKNTTRPMLPDREIERNYRGIRRCLEPLFRFGNGDTDALILNNASWLGQIDYISFLRDIGKFFSINRMIGFDSVKTRLSDGNSLSFLEFNYMILQAYDFYNLFIEKNCKIQFGGQDQWGNIVCGVELIRKKLNEEVFGFTVPLLTTSDGKKMGKTANGAVWISAEKLTPYDFWQYWRNVSDADVIRLMYLFTDLEVSEIKRMENVRGSELNSIKKILADEITSIIHGKDVLPNIHETANGAFGGDIASLAQSTSIPRYKLSRRDIDDISVIDIAVKMNMCSSRADAKRLLHSNGIYINNKAVQEGYRLSEESERVIKLSCGKKRHILIEIVD